MTPERFTQRARALTGCAAGVLTGVLDVLAALEEASGRSVASLRHGQRHNGRSDPSQSQ